MNRISIIAISFFLLVDCGCTQSKSDLDGLWARAYQIETDSNRRISDFKEIIHIDGDSILFVTTGEPKNGFDALRRKSKFKRTDYGIQIENENLDKIYLHEITNDSLVFSYETHNSTREVYQRLDQSGPKKVWKPQNKSYEWRGNSALVNTKFLDNGLLIDYQPKDDDVSVGHWHTIEVGNNLFMVFDKLNIIALSVDSLAKDRVHLSVHDEKRYNYTLVEYDLELPKHILGDWTLVSSDTIMSKRLPSPKGFKWPVMDFLSILKDSILIVKNEIKSTKKWTIGGTNNLIIFPDETIEKDSLGSRELTKKERVVLTNILKIDSLSKDILVLLTEYEKVELDGFEIKLTYRRVKTKANKTYEQ